MKIFVAGATGAIGHPLIAQLLGKGHDVVAMTVLQKKPRPWQNKA
jgi:nucleoside-diphosphate-sugar epimerase